MSPTLSTVFSKISLFINKIIFTVSLIKEWGTVLYFVRPGRIELPSTPWQGVVIPLNYGRLSSNITRILPCDPTSAKWQDSFSTRTVRVSCFFSAKLPKNRLNLFESCTYSAQALYRTHYSLRSVRPAGFEPTTPWFEAKYSIH